MTSHFLSFSKIMSTPKSTSQAALPFTFPFNPSSKWEEHTEIEGVTLFELYGPCRKAETDKTVMKTLSTKVLDSELRCPICLMYLKNTHIVMECLHRFCGDCIQKSIRIGKKECPSCRLHLPSRRSLRPDPNFDALLVTLYGDIGKLEEVRRREGRLDGVLDGALQRSDS